MTPHSECDGTYVNFQQRLQRFRKAITPRGDALWAPELLRRIAVAADGAAEAAEAGSSFGWLSFNALWRDLAAGEPAFAGIEVSKLGGIGQTLVAGGTAAAMNSAGDRPGVRVDGAAGAAANGAAGDNGPREA